MSKTFVKENVSEGEFKIYKVLNRVSETYNPLFKTLILPGYITYDKPKRTLTLPFYDGRNFNGRWDESNGGLGIGLELINKSIGMIDDLMSINIEELPSSVEFFSLPKSIFDDAAEDEYYLQIASKLEERGFISKKSLLSIKEAMGYKQSSGMILSNGDFYPRNFIECNNGRVVLVDWEPWSANHNPFYLIDHPENVAATLFVHMWGDASWQKSFLESLKLKFGFSDPSLKKGITIKSLALSNLWLENSKDLVRSQMCMLDKVLSKQY